ncbi:carbohydrate ABC transporter permease [uncultured Microbacterium sp.]|uniref:ABC-type transporter, integral membrane subunit n=1 Tax=uncultured Microbacterium sp. TaxID=191216 RepID=A0A1Y5P069_9MICO|nr:sugar ABC transporter permease [uncultured Microbacterium sp.]SBS72087.1 ABC-type transporter, integral membrane subunit [uncultured Microbacterium sp.]
MAAATIVADDPTQRARDASRARAHRRNAGTAVLFLSPWIIGFLVFTAWPLIYSAYLSLTDYDVINDPTFVGLDNFAELFDDPKVGLALSNTFLFTALQVPLYVIVSLLLALLLHRAGRASGFYRTIFFLPKMTPPVAVGVLFLLLFNGQNGLFNSMLGTIGIDGPSWTTDPAWVKPGLVIMSLWTVGASVIILLAALQSVPEELYESARLDGAGFWRQSLSVTLPMISPALFFIVIVNTIAGLQTFDEAYTAFFGAGNTTYSNDAALFYVIYLFQQAFEFLHMGYASALAWVLFALIMVVTTVQILISRRLVYYEGEEAR